MDVKPIAFDSPVEPKLAGLPVSSSEEAMAKQEADDYQRHVYLPELLAEKESLGPSFVHCARLLDKGLFGLQLSEICRLKSIMLFTLSLKSLLLEIDRVKYGGAPSVPSQVTLSEKIEVPVKDFPGVSVSTRDKCDLKYHGIFIITIIQCSNT